MFERLKLVTNSKIKKPISRKWFVVYILPIYALFIGLFIAQPWIGIVNKNLSGSLPQKYFWTSFFNKNVAKGDLVTFYSKLEGLEGDMIIKIVGGVAGDLVTVKDEKVYINDRLIGGFKKAYFNKKLVTPINKDMVIPKGKIFVYTPHAFSLDSRYQEMGLIDRKQILGRAYGIY